MWWCCWWSMRPTSNVMMMLMMMFRMVIMTLHINAELIHNKLVFFLYDKINDHISSVRHVMMLWQDDSWMIRSTSLTPHLSPSQDDIFTSLILSKKLSQSTNFMVLRLVWCDSGVWSLCYIVNLLNSVNCLWIFNFLLQNYLSF